MRRWWIGAQLLQAVNHGRDRGSAERVESALAGRWCMEAALLMQAAWASAGPDKKKKALSESHGAATGKLPPASGGRGLGMPVRVTPPSKLATTSILCR